MKNNNNYECTCNSDELYSICKHHYNFNGTELDMTQPNLIECIKLLSEQLIKDFGKKY